LHLRFPVPGSRQYSLVDGTTLGQYVGPDSVSTAELGGIFGTLDVN
jgi:hypothetical protein